MLSEIKILISNDNVQVLFDETPFLFVDKYLLGDKDWLKKVCRILDMLLEYEDLQRYAQ